jgi:hypothetical protein
VLNEQEVAAYVSSQDLSLQSSKIQRVFIDEDRNQSGSLDVDGNSTSLPIVLKLEIF